MLLTEPNILATHQPNTLAAKSSQPPPSPEVTRQRFAEEYLCHVLTAIDLDSSVIDYVIVDSDIRKFQIILSMTEDQLR